MGVAYAYIDGQWLEMRDAVSYALDLLKVKAVCIDEAQQLMQADAAQRPSIQLDWLKSLTNRSDLLYVPCLYIP